MNENLKIRAGALVALLTLLIALAGQARAAGEILIQGAMDVEIDYLVNHLESSRQIDIDGFRFWQGNINGRPVVVAKTEIGVVNAALSTELAIKKFEPQAIINQGTAGGYPAFVEKGDIVIGKMVFDSNAIITQHRDAKQGLDVSQWRLNNSEFAPRYYPDSAWLARAVSCSNNFPARFHVGSIASANRWTREMDLILMWYKTENALCEEMEAGAAAAVAKRYSVPFLAVRCISNSEINNGDYDSSEVAAITEVCQKYICVLLNAG